MTEFKIKELIFLIFLSLQIVESLRQCVGCKEKVKIKWEKLRPNIIMKMKIDSKSKNIELQKSPLVLDPYDPQNQDTCIFEGYWDANKHKTPITVLGCPHGQEIEIFINFKKLKHLVFQFEKDGYHQATPRSSINMLNYTINRLDEFFGPSTNVRKNVPYVQMKKHAIPSAGFSVPISVQYDKSFKTAWGAKSLFAIRGMLAIVQNIYRWDTWKVKLEFQLVSQIIFNSRHSFKIARFFTPDGGVTDNEADNLIDLMKLNDKDAAVNLYFTNEPLEMSNGGQKAAFSGWRGISKEKRDDNFNFAVISAPFGKNPEMKPPEYDTIFASIATHALNPAHEIGHILGLRHDFDFHEDSVGEDSNVIRKDTKGKKCTNTKSVMDYPKDGVQIKWSTCSNEDFHELYNMEMDKYNKYGLDTL